MWYSEVQAGAARNRKSEFWGQEEGWKLERKQDPGLVVYAVWAGGWTKSTGSLDLSSSNSVSDTVVKWDNWICHASELTDGCVQINGCGRFFVLELTKLCRCFSPASESLYYVAQTQFTQAGRKEPCIHVPTGSPLSWEPPTASLKPCPCSGGGFRPPPAPDSWHRRSTPTLDSADCQFLLHWSVVSLKFSWNTPVVRMWCFFCFLRNVCGNRIFTWQQDTFFLFWCCCYLCVGLSPLIFFYQFDNRCQC